MLCLLNPGLVARLRVLLLENSLIPDVPLELRGSVEDCGKESMGVSLPSIWQVKANDIYKQQ